MKTLTHNDYLVGWICALPVEMAAASLMLDSHHLRLSQGSQDHNSYVLGDVFGHNIVISCLPAGIYGVTSATASVLQMRSTFPQLRFALMVGIGGGVPTKFDIRLGDVVVSQPTGTCGGVVQYDFGKPMPNGRFERVGLLNKPPPILLTAVSHLRARHIVGKRQIGETINTVLSQNHSIMSTFDRPDPTEDRLFNASYNHVESQPTCIHCASDQLVYREPRPSNDLLRIHYGLIASGNQVIKDGNLRDRLAEELGIQCFEMEAAGIMDQVPCLVIRGVCDYSDSHKNKSWQGYAALTAAAFAKELLSAIPTHKNHMLDTIVDETNSLPYNTTGSANAATGRVRPVKSPVISQLAKNDMRDAQDQLRAVVEDRNSGRVLDLGLTLQDIKKTAIEIERDLATNQCLRNMRRIIPLLDGLHNFSSLVDVLCDGYVRVSWLWVPIKRILERVSEYVDGIDRLMKVYAKVAVVLKSLDKPTVNTSNDKAPQRVLALIYRDILDLHRETYHLVHLQGWNSLVDILWSRFERRVKLILDNLAEDAELLVQQPSGTNISTIIDRRAESLREWEKNEEEQLTVERQAVLTWLEEKHLSQEDQLDDLCTLQHKGSCNWILENRAMQSWTRVDSQNTILWLAGKPGAGKSVLSATIIKRLKQDVQNTVLYHFCGNTLAQGQVNMHVLRSLMLQLLEGNIYCTSYVYSSYVRKGLLASVGQLRGLFQFLLTVIPSVRIVIDGVDELPEANQERLLNEVLPLAEHKTDAYSCKILISSRDTTSLSLWMVGKAKVDLNKERESLNVGIHSFIKHELRAIRGGLDDVDIESQAMLELENALIDKADGMYLWVRLVLSSIRQAQTLAQLRSTVHQLPKGLKEMYDKIVHDMLGRATESIQKVAINILSWIVYSKRPLTSIELISGASIDENNLDFGEEHRLRFSTLGSCRPLIEQGRNGTIRLIHFTVHEYFVQGPGTRFIDPIQAHNDMAFTCLTYLSFSLNLVDTGISAIQKCQEIVTGSHALCNYVSNYWTYHIQFCLDNRNGTSESRIARVIRQAQKLYQSHFSFPIASDPYADNIERDRTAHNSPLPDIPTILEFITASAEFRNRVKEQTFTSGQDVFQYKLSHDRTLFTMMYQAYYTLMQHLSMASKETLGVNMAQLERFKQKYAVSAFVCRFIGCHDAFSSISDLEEHESSRHSVGIKCTESSCPFSRIGFPSLRALQNHIQTYHSETLPTPRPTSIRRRFKCDGCSERFRLGDELAEHRALRQGTSCALPPPRNIDEGSIHMSGANHIPSDSHLNNDTIRSRRSNSSTSTMASTVAYSSPENEKEMMNHFAQALQSQGPFTDWRGEVPIEDRALETYYIFTSLRLIQPQIGLQSAVEAALRFEQKAFKDAVTKLDYDKECNEKLTIRNTLARHAAVMQKGMRPSNAPIFR